MGTVTLIPGIDFGSSGGLQSKKFTIPAANVTGTHTDYPLMVKLHDDVRNGAQADGSDIYFTSDAAGQNRLGHQLRLGGIPAGVIMGSGIWTWFCRYTVMYANGHTYITPVSGSGLVTVAQYNHATEAIEYSQHEHNASSGFEDDHNPGASIRLSDGKILLAWTAHAANRYIRYATTTSADDISSWGSVNEIDEGAGALLTYVQLFRLTSEGTGSGRLYLFYRADGLSANREWRYRTSDDDGATWSSPTVWYVNTSSPYPVITSNGTDRIDAAVSDNQPPDGAGNDLYHLYWDGSNWNESDGTSLGAIPAAGYTSANLDGTSGDVYSPGTDAAWAIDIAYNSSGNPVILYGRWPGNFCVLSEYRVSEWNGTSWDADTLIDAGGNIKDPAAGNDYLGNGCIDPADSTVVYLSRRPDTIEGRLTGASKYFSIADNADVSFGDEDFSFACIINAHSDGTSQQNVILFKGATEYILTVETDGKMLWGRDSGFIHTSSAVITDGQDHHVMAIHDTSQSGFDRWRLFVDNVEVAHTTNGTYSAPTDGTGDFRLGRRDADTKSFVGVIKRAALAREAWDAADRTWVYNGGSGRTSSEWSGDRLTNAVGLWDLDETTWDADAVDDSGSGNTLTAQDNPPANHDGTWEIEKWEKSAGSWSMTESITSGSTYPNIRPYIPLDSTDRTQPYLFWVGGGEYYDFVTVNPNTGYPYGGGILCYPKNAARGTTKPLWATVKVPSIGSSDTDVYCWYGGSNSEAATSPWDANYKLVEEHNSQGWYTDNYTQRNGAGSDYKINSMFPTEGRLTIDPQMSLLYNTGQSFSTIERILKLVPIIDLASATDLTLELWFKAYNIGTKQRIHGHKTHTNTKAEWEAFLTTTSKVQNNGILEPNSAFQSAYDAPTPKSGVEHHLVLYFDHDGGSGGVARFGMRLDKVEDFDDHASSAAFDADSASVQHLFGTNGNAFQGIVADYRLSVGAVRSANWTDTAYDAVKNPNFVEWDGDTITPVATLTSARDFTAASSQYFNRASSASLQTGDVHFTLATWVYLDASGTQVLMAKDTGSHPNREYLLFFGSSKFQFFVFTNAATAGSVGTTNTYTTGQWYWVCAWHDPDANKVYIQVDNGAVDSANTSAAPQAASTDFTLGANAGPSLHLDGRLAGAALFKPGDVLTNADRHALWRAGEGIKYGGLDSELQAKVTAFWDLDESSGNAVDSSGNSLDLTDNNGIGTAGGPDA